MNSPVFGDVLIYGTVMSVGVRQVGGKQRSDGSVSSLRNVAFAEILTTRGLVLCEEWDKASYDGPAASTVGVFQVRQVGRFWNNVQSYGGTWLDRASIPDLQGLHAQSKKGAAA